MFIGLCAVLREILWCFLLGGFLLPDRLSADSLSDSVGHRGCDVTAEGFREMQLSKWTHPKTLLLHCQFILLAVYSAYVMTKCELHH